MRAWTVTAVLYLWPLVCLLLATRAVLSLVLAAPAAALLAPLPCAVVTAQVLPMLVPLVLLLVLLLSNLALAVVFQHRPVLALMAGMLLCRAGWVWLVAVALLPSLPGKAPMAPVTCLQRLVLRLAKRTAAALL